MLVGCYYRCPIALEHNDTLFPRFFVLGQVTEYNQLSDTVVVKMHDVLKSSAYYGALLQNNIFRAQDIVRCEGVSGGAALYDNARVKV